MRCDTLSGNYKLLTPARAGSSRALGVHTRSTNMLYSMRIRARNPRHPHPLFVEKTYIKSTMSNIQWFKHMQPLDHNNTQELNTIRCY